MKKVEIFVGPNCSYCAAARQTLYTFGIPFSEYNIAAAEHLAEYRRRLPRSRSIPQIFIAGSHIGNEQDLANLAAAGKLLALVYD